MKGKVYFIAPMICALVYIYMRDFLYIVFEESSRPDISQELWNYSLFIRTGYKKGKFQPNLPNINKSN